MAKTTTTNHQSSSTDDGNNASAGDGSGNATTPPQSPRPLVGRRKKMLSFEPNQDFFVVDSTAEGSTTPKATNGGGDNRVRQRSHEQTITPPSRTLSSPPLMGPIMHRKRVLSMPLCSDASNEFFQGGLVAATGPSAPIIEENIAEDGTVGSSSSQQMQHIQRQLSSNIRRPHDARMRQNTAPISGTGFFLIDDADPSRTTDTAGKRPRKKTSSFMAGLLARRAVAMDLLPADDADLGMYEFFHPVEHKKKADVPVGLENYGEESKEDVEDLETGTTAVKEEDEGEEEGEEFQAEEEVAATMKKKKLFKPLIFAPRRMMLGGGAGGGGHGHHGGGGHLGHPHGGGGAFCDIVASTQEGQSKDKKPADITDANDDTKNGTVLDASEAVPLTAIATAPDNDTPSDKKQHEDEFIEDGEEDVDVDNESILQKQSDSHIIQATKKDYFFTGFLVIVMAALVGVVVGWPTHLDESDSIFGPVGLACKTPCRGDIYDQDYFLGYNRFHAGDVIYLTPHIDATLTENSYLRMAIRGVETNKTKWVSSDNVFGPANVDGKRVTKEARVIVDWEHPEEQHVVDVWSTVSCYMITFFPTDVIRDLA